MTLDEIYAIPLDADGWRVLPGGNRLHIGTGVNSGIDLAKINDRARIGSYAEIGCGARIGNGAVICPYARIGSGARIGNDVVIGIGAVIGPYARIGIDAVIGCRARIGGRRDADGGNRRATDVEGSASGLGLLNGNQRSNCRYLALDNLYREGRHVAGQGGIGDQHPGIGLVEVEASQQVAGNALLDQLGRRKWVIGVCGHWFSCFGT